MPTTTVSQTTYTDDEDNEQVQYRTTIPKGLAEALDLGGERVEWSVESQNTLSLSVVDNE